MTNSSNGFHHRQDSSITGGGEGILGSLGGGDLEQLSVLMHTIDFAARKHSSQRRKDVERTPYINHPIGVSANVANYLTRSGVTHLPTLQAAILHDTVEDTDTSSEELRQKFGEEVTRIVMECTDEKHLCKQDRKDAQVRTASKKSDEAKHVKLADKMYNCKDLSRCPPPSWTPDRVQEYFVWSKRVTDQCDHVNPWLANQLDVLYRTAYFTIDGKEYKANPTLS